MADFPYRLGYKMGRIEFRRRHKAGDAIGLEQAKDEAEQMIYLPDESEVWSDSDTRDFADGFMDGYTSSIKNGSEWTETS